MPTQLKIVEAQAIRLSPAERNHLLERLRMLVVWHQSRKPSFARTGIERDAAPFFQEIRYQIAL